MNGLPRFESADASAEIAATVLDAIEGMAAGIPDQESVLSRIALLDAPAALAYATALAAGVVGVAAGMYGVESAVIVRQLRRSTVAELDETGGAA